MTLKRIFLIVITAIAMLFLGSDLVASFSKPQFQGRLALYESDLKLHLSEFKSTDPQSLQLKKMVDDSTKPVDAALTEYQTARKQVQTTLAAPKIQATDRITQQKNLEEVSLRLGILQMQSGKLESAQQVWTELTTNATTSAQTRQTATILNGLWNDPPRVLADAEPTLKQSLDGWYEYRSIDRLYEVQARTTDRKELQRKERATAQSVLTKLGISGVTATASFASGIVLILVTIAQWVWKREDSWLGGLNETRWTVAWDWEDTWLVMVAGFFLVGQIVVGVFVAPLLRAIGLALQNEFALTDDVYKGIMILSSYAALASGSIAVLYFTIKQHLPLDKNWFRVSLSGNWLPWGLGGYLVAFPLVLGVSILNSQIWQGQGGSNPLLPIVLEGKSPVALALFLVTTAIAAPVFEELLFRGFLLPSLSRYFSTWNAVLLSGLIFAVVHLSLAEVLPLTVLGIVLGFVYARTQNLLASMLLHGLWNAGTILSLYLLGSAGR
jgi:uncharacterized protein